MERKFLQELGLEKDAIDKVMAEYGRSVEAYKAKADEHSKEREALCLQVKELSDKLNTFDGVDVDVLKGEIESLKADIEQKETDFSAKLADRDFAAMLAQGITAAKGRNAKAISALLDIDALKASVNQREDIAAALKKAAETDAYLFGAQENATPASVNTGGQHGQASEAAGSFVQAAMKGAGL